MQKTTAEDTKAQEAFAKQVEAANAVKIKTTVKAGRARRRSAAITY